MFRDTLLQKNRTGPKGVKMKRLLFPLLLFFIFSISYPFHSFAEGDRPIKDQTQKDADSAKEKAETTQEELKPMDVLQLSPAEFMARYQKEEAEMRNAPRSQSRPGKACGCSVALPGGAR
jgi:hypothetical protein